MRFRNRKTGEIFEDISAARFSFCNTKCRECPISCFKNDYEIECGIYCNAYTYKAAILMGFDVIDDKPSKKIQPSTKRLIDGTEFIRELTLDTSRGFYGEFMDGSEIAYTSREIVSMVNNMHTIDAVPVVRCRDCKYYRDSSCIEHGCSSVYGLNEPDDDDFCSYGEPKEDKNEI